MDDKEIIYQAADICRGCWHVGIDYGGELFGIVNNRNSIGIEMCVQKGYCLLYTSKVLYSGFR